MLWYMYLSIPYLDLYQLPQFSDSLNQAVLEGGGGILFSACPSFRHSIYLSYATTLQDDHILVSKKHSKLHVIVVVVL